MLGLESWGDRLSRAPQFTDTRDGSEGVRGWPDVSWDGHAFGQGRSALNARLKCWKSLQTLAPRLHPEPTKP